MFEAFLLALMAQTAPLTKLIEKCDPIAISHGGCGDLDKPVWRSFRDVTGEITKINMRSIEPMQGGSVLVTTYTFSPGSSLDLSRLRQLYFTCRGQYADTANLRVLHDAPPRSVAGIIARTVCPIGNQKRTAILARNARVEAEQHARAMKPRAEDYCQGFSDDECAIIQSGVNARTAPDYCQPGYGRVGSGLSKTQIRICNARPLDDEPGEEAGGQGESPPNASAGVARPRPRQRRERGSGITPTRFF